MNRIQFSEDWDKLRSPRFTTIRSYRREKEEYYRSLIGQTLLVWRATGRSRWNGRKVGTATLRSVSVVVPSELGYETLRADVLLRGVPSITWMDKIVGMDRALLLEFENHTGILAEGVPA